MASGRRRCSLFFFSPLTSSCFHHRSLAYALQSSFSIDPPPLTLVFRLYLLISTHLSPLRPLRLLKHGNHITLLLLNTSLCSDIQTYFSSLPLLSLSLTFLLSASSFLFFFFYYYFFYLLTVSRALVMNSL